VAPVPCAIWQADLMAAGLSVMFTASQNLYLSASIQLLLTVFLITVLWSLYNCLYRFDFFRWWAWAWTAFSCFLASATISMYLGPQWSPLKGFFVLILIVAGVLQPVLLVLGGLSWFSPGQPSRRSFWWGIGLALLGAALSFLLALLLRQNAMASLASRSLLRTVTMAAALFFSCAVFWRHSRKTRSVAAAITGLFCFSYACDQIVYFLSFGELAANHWGIQFPPLLHKLASFQYLDLTWLLYLDLVDTCGICLGMILLLLERHQFTASELATSERRRLGLAVDNVSLQIQIQERERIENDLRRSEAFSRQVVLNSPVAMIVAHGQSEQVEFINEKFTCLFGYGKDEIRQVSDWWPRAYPDPQYRQSVQSTWQALIDKANRGSSEPLAMEARVTCADGSLRDIEFHLSLVNDLYLVSFVDLTERKQALNNLRESESKFRLVADTVSAAIWLLQDNRFVYFNKEVERITGYSHEEVLAMNPFNLIAPEFREQAYGRTYARLHGESLSPHFHFAILTKSGERRWVDFSAALTQFEGKPAVLASAFDVTSMLRAQQELKDHAMYVDALISNIPLGIVIKDEDQLVRFCNPAFEKMFQFSQEEIQGKQLDEFIAPHDFREAALLSSAVQHGGAIHTTARRLRKDGTFLDVELYGVKVFSGESFVGAFAIYQDISERKRAEDKLLALRNRLTRAQEEERARIARDLHDDAGQRLALLSIDLEQLKQASTHLKTSLTHQLESLVKVASEITSDIHNVSRRLHPSQVELLGLRRALTNFCREFGARNGMDIEFTVSGELQDPSHDAALCLFRVAQEAIHNVQKHSGCQRALVQLYEFGGCFSLCVSDEGSGFDPDSVEYSEGLGLLSMQERLHSLGGELSVHSRLGQGTRVEASLPISRSITADTSR
jgi:two-component system, NarL family, sensor kinase